MGPLTIVMALLLAAGVLAGTVLALSGPAELALAAALVLAGTAVLLAAAYRAVEPLESVARRAWANRKIRAARLLAILFGLLPMLALVALQLVAGRLLDRPAPPLFAAGCFYAVATGPATLLAALAGRERRTLWSIRAYGAHLGAWALLAIGAPSIPPLGALLALLPAVLPVTVGALIALADPRALRAARI